MKYKRSFIIEISSDSYTTVYITDIIKNSSGYYYTKTNNLDNAKQWKYKKNCENSIETLINKFDPTKFKPDDCKFDIIEITDNQILRSVKLKKINK